MSSDPLMQVRVKTDSALPSVQPPPTPLKVTELPKAIPMVMVLPVVVAVNVIVADHVRVTPVEATVMLPATVMFELPAQVTLPVAGPAIVMSAQVAPVPTVTV